jgi:hypothetical protein
MGMQTTVRYYRGCGADTGHWSEGIGQFRSWRWILIELALTPLMRWLDPWHYDLCRAWRLETTREDRTG